MYKALTSTACFAGYPGFDHEDRADQPVTHAGALLIKEYPADPPDRHEEQLCMLLGHDRNLGLWAPAAGHVDLAKDFEIRERGRFYLSHKTIQREVLEETGGKVVITNEALQRLPLLYSSKFQDLLAVVRDDTLSVKALNEATQRAIADPHKDGAWKEMDGYEAFPIANIIDVAQIMRNHFNAGGNINNLPAAILSPKRALHLNTPLVYVDTRSNGRKEVCAYYMGAIADTLTQFQDIVNQEEQNRLAAQRQREEQQRQQEEQRRQQEAQRLRQEEQRRQQEAQRLRQEEQHRQQEAQHRQQEEQKRLSAAQHQRVQARLVAPQRYKGEQIHPQMPSASPLSLARLAPKPLTRRVALPQRPALGLQNHALVLKNKTVNFFTSKRPISSAFQKISRGMPPLTKPISRGQSASLILKGRGNNLSAFQRPAPLTLFQTIKRAILPTRSSSSTIHPTLQGINRGIAPSKKLNFGLQKQAWHPTSKVRNLSVLPSLSHPSSQRMGRKMALSNKLGFAMKTNSILSKPNKLSFRRGAQAPSLYSSRRLLWQK